MEEEQQEQSNSRPWLYKKGQSGNPGGRPPGILSMKEYIKKKLATMTEEEREVFLEGIDKKTIWEMAEGKPQQDADVQVRVINVVVPPEVAKAFNIDATHTETIGGDTEQV